MINCGLGALLSLASGAGTPLLVGIASPLVAVCEAEAEVVAKVVGSVNHRVDPPVVGLVTVLNDEVISADLVDFAVAEVATLEVFVVASSAVAVASFSCK